MTTIRFNDVIQFDNGLFTHMPTEMFSTRFDVMDMDIETSITCGDMPIAPIVEKFMDNSIINEEKLNRLASLIYRRFSEQWKRKYAILETTYDVLDNYNMVESENVARDELYNRLNDIATSTNNQSSELRDLIHTIKNIQTTTTTDTGTDKTTTTDNALKTDTTTVTGNNIDTFNRLIS